MGLINAREAGRYKTRLECEVLPSNVIFRKVKNALEDGDLIHIESSAAALIVEEGRVVDFSAQAGDFVWEEASEPSCFTDGAHKGMLESFKKTGGSFTYKANTDKKKYVYYFDLGEITDNKFGTVSPIRYYDKNYKTALYIRYYGTFSFRVADPILFFASRGENVGNEYKKDELWQHINGEFTEALDAAVAECASRGIKFSELPSKQAELSHLMGEAFVSRGIELSSVWIAKVTPDDRSRALIAKSNPALSLVGCNKAERMSKGVMPKSKGTISALMAKGYEKTAEPQQDKVPQRKAPTEIKGSISAVMARGYGKNGESQESKATRKESTDRTAWICPACGMQNNGKFCSECGRKRKI